VYVCTNSEQSRGSPTGCPSENPEFRGHLCMHMRVYVCVCVLFVAEETIEHF
jgi:hypothetical protein